MDDLIEILTPVFGAIPAWISIPIALLGWAMIYFIWAQKFSSMPPLNKFGWMFGALFAMAVLIAGWKGHQVRRNREKFIADTINPDWLKQLSWQDFEKLVANFYRQGGYSVEEVGGGGADGGIDLILWKNSQKTIVQCKHWKTYKVGAEKVRELYGVQTSENAVKSILITSGIFTQEALNFAEGKPLELIDGAQCFQMTRQLQ
ncbi:MAG TPA: restriction endonuclease, partial [Verrucomicrobiae bacterium]|nr:restriction endonuclease [Verrucomicrobiae bacterium]